MHLNKIGEVNVVLQECIEIFKEQMEKEAKAGRDIILDEYRPAEGDYIIVKKDGSLMSCSIKEDKKKKTMEGINESDSLYRGILTYLLIQEKSIKMLTVLCMILFISR